MAQALKPGGIKKILFVYLKYERMKYNKEILEESVVYAIQILNFILFVEIFKEDNFTVITLFKDKRIILTKSF
jgi:hypothetical protein